MGKKEGRSPPKPSPLERKAGFGDGNISHYGVAAGRATNFRDLDARAKPKADDAANTPLSTSEAAGAAAKSTADDLAKEVAASDAADAALEQAESLRKSALLLAKKKVAELVAVPRLTGSWADEVERQAAVDRLSDGLSLIHFSDDDAAAAAAAGLESAKENPSGNQSAEISKDTEMTSDVQEPTPDIAPAATTVATSTDVQQDSVSSNADKASNLDEQMTVSRCEECQAICLSGRHTGQCDPVRRQEAVRQMAEQVAKKAETAAKKAEKTAAHTALLANHAQQKAEKLRLRQETHQERLRQQAEAKAEAKAAKATNKAGKRPQTAANQGTAKAPQSNADSVSPDVAMVDATSAPKDKAAALPKGNQRSASFRKEKSSHGPPLCPGCHRHHFGGCDRQLSKSVFEQREQRLLDAMADAETKHEYEAIQRRYRELLASQAVEQSNTGGKRRARSPPAKERPAKRHDDKERRPGV